ncbi:MAG: hypothetical protein Q4G59_02665 [Planctomycetia bacterium]|nr:hypothetical protein [Planctomycetia bacterium]
MFYYYLKTWSYGAICDENWEKQNIKYCPECGRSFFQKYDSIEFRDGAFDASVVMGSLSIGDFFVRYLRDDFLDLLPELKDISTFGTLVNAKTKELLPNWTLVYAPQITLRGSQASSFRACRVCRRIFYMRSEPYSILEQDI